MVDFVGCLVVGKLELVKGSAVSVVGVLSISDCELDVASCVMLLCSGSG